MDRRMSWHFWVVFVAAVLWQGTRGATISPPGYCTTLTASAQQRTTNPCVYVVNYPFFVPNGWSLEALRTKAVSSLNNTQLLSLTPNCQGALVRYTCSLIYRKCQPGIVLNNTATYNYNIYANDTGLTIPVPVQRPCVYVCHSLSTICADPLFVFATGGFPNCYTKYDYGGLSSPLPYQFDLKNDASKCYSPRFIPLSGPTEKYSTVTAPCYGIVDEYYVLPGSKLSPSFTVLQPAYITQSIINSGLENLFSHLPRYLTPDCNAAIRQYFCYQYFFKPQAVTVRQGLIAGVAGTPYQAMLTQIQTAAINSYPGLLDRKLYFPRYANRSMCDHYDNVCHGFINRIPALHSNCSKRTGGHYLFPSSENQTLLSTTFHVAVAGNTTTLNLVFSTSPDYSGYRNDSRLNYSVICPPNFSINPDGDNDHIVDIAGTGCALNCRTGFWTDSEWSSFDQFGVIVSVISFVFCVIVMITIVATNDWKASYLIFFFTCTSFISSMYHFAITAGTPWMNRFCSSDVLRRRVSSGPSNCMRHATMSSFLYLAGCILIFLMALQRALELSGHRAVLSRPSYGIFQFVITLFPPLVSIAVALKKDFLGFGGITPWCAMDLVPAVYLMGFPVLVICGLTFGIYMYGTIRGARGNHSTKVVAVASSIYQIGNTESSSFGEPSAAAVSNSVYSGMTVISIGATVDISSIPACEEGGTENVASLPTGAAATPAAHSEIEMKQLVSKKYVEYPEHQVAGAVSSKPALTDDAAHTLRMNIIITAFIAGSIVIHIGWVILKFGDFYRGERYVNSLVEYLGCIFVHWDYATKESYISKCGTHPSFRPSHPSIQFYILCLFGNMLVMGPIYLASSLIAYRFTKKVKHSNANGNNSIV
jgi:hypothetical protein